MSLPDMLLIDELLDGYRARRFTPLQVIEEVLERIAQAPERNAWITRIPREQLLAWAAALADKDMDALPLYGIPFAIKDNIDLAGVVTTAGCPEYAYVPAESAHVIRQLIEAGAIPIGKTNLDQFATGLVGTRSPYGVGVNAFDARYISGGSSSGSAIAVATGVVSFSLGTDTAGSGRVPAAFNNLVGLKPTCGRLSTRGVVPACRSLDCVSIFAATAADAARVLAVAEGFDAAEAYSRSAPSSFISPLPASFRFGVPRATQLEFFGDAEYARLFEEAVVRLESLGGRRVEIDFEPFLATARLLYEGPWVAERYAAVGAFVEHMLPVTRQIISGGRLPTAADAFRAQYRLKELERRTSAVWSDIDVLVTPTAGTIYRIDEVVADPLRLNSNLGYYTNFVNLLDQAAVAAPAGFRSDGLPFGVTFIGRAWSDSALLMLADRFHGAGHSVIKPWPVMPPSSGRIYISVAVCGAHMEGLPLNHQLTDRGAHLLSKTRTAETYKFFALSGGPPFRPGLVRVAEGGASIELEVWAVPAEHFGSFVAGIPSPLGIGKVLLEDGTLVSGFICEPHAVTAARDITSMGSWRRYLTSI